MLGCIVNVRGIVLPVLLRFASIESLSCNKHTYFYTYSTLEVIREHRWSIGTVNNMDAVSRTRSGSKRTSSADESKTRRLTRTQNLRIRTSLSIICSPSWGCWLFHKVRYSFHHLLHTLLPEHTNHPYHLRSRTHSFTLPSQHDERNFIDRLLFKNANPVCTQ